MNSFNLKNTMTNIPSFSNQNTNLIPENNFDINTFDIIKIVVLILILAIMGFNVFVLFARGTEWAAKLVEKSAKFGIDLTFLSIKDTVNFSKNTIHSTIKGNLKDLQNSIGSKKKSPTKAQLSYLPDRDSSDIQRNKNQGYCLVGTDKGFRSCTYVGTNDVCKSGKIYPTIDICKDPKLRK
jgi:hypothetical protein